MHDARIKLLQGMPIFGGIRADVLQFLLGLCPVVSVPTNEYFFHEHDQADSMFVLEAGKVAVLKFGEMAVMDLSTRSASVRSKIALQSVFQQLTSISFTSRILSSSR